MIRKIGGKWAKKRQGNVFLYNVHVKKLLPDNNVQCSNNCIGSAHGVSSPVNVVIYPKQIATVMKPSFRLTIYMYKQHIKNQPKSNIWKTVKFEQQILHYFYAGQNVNIHIHI